MRQISAAHDEQDGQDDPYAPTESSHLFGDLPDFDRQGTRNRLSSFGSNTGSVRGAVYRSTLFDRQRANMKGKTRRQIFAEQAMRDMYF